MGDSDEFPALEDVLLGKLAPQVEDFILPSPRLSTQRIKAHAGRRPLVLLNRDVPGIPRVLIDAAAGFEEAVDPLPSFGHCRDAGRRSVELLIAALNGRVLPKTKLVV